MSADICGRYKGITGERQSQMETEIGDESFSRNVDPDLSKRLNDLLNTPLYSSSNPFSRIVSAGQIAPTESLDPVEQTLGNETIAGEKSYTEHTTSPEDYVSIGRRDDKSPVYEMVSGILKKGKIKKKGMSVRFNE